VKSNVIVSSFHKAMHLVDWDVDVLKWLLQLIIVKRSSQPRKSTTIDAVLKTKQEIQCKDGMTFDKMQEIITLPKLDARTNRKHLDPNAVQQIPPIVVAQLHKYIEAIAYTYRDNPFHTFEHASHVTISVSKLLSRIVAPNIELEGDDDDAAANLVHDHTYGITSNPLTQFAVVLSALIHDADHVGLLKFLLINKNKSIVAAYKNKSIAEQKSVNLACSMLMEPRFSDGLIGICI
jgi:hypothetical protein